MPHTATIAGRRVGVEEPVYILAEMACAHDGSAHKAKQLVDAAKGAGADGVQLQFYSTDDLVTPSNDIYSLLKRIELDREAWADVHAHARESGLHVWACTFDLPSVALAGQLGVDAIKLNSSDLSNPDMLQAVAGLGVPFTLGCGASTMDEIALGLETARAAGGTDIVLMHGVQNFPTPLEDANLRRITQLKSLFGDPVGYADHTDATLPAARYIDLAALGLGARLLEKHITLSRAEKGVDYQAALEPGELAEYVTLMREVDGAMGANELKPLTTSDKRYRTFQKKSVVACRDLAAGHVLTGGDVRFLRTGAAPELPPSRLPELLGRALNKNVTALTPLRHEDLA